MLKNIDYIFIVYHSLVRDHSSFKWQCISDGLYEKGGFLNDSKIKLRFKKCFILTKILLDAANVQNYNKNP